MGININFKSKNKDNNNKSIVITMIKAILTYWKPLLIIVIAYLLFFEPETFSVILSYIVRTIREVMINV